MASTALAIAQVGGAVYSGMAANAEGKSAQNLAEYNAKVYESQATATEQAARYKQARQAEEAERYASGLKAGLGASGAVSTEGAPLEILARQASESERDILMTGYEGSIEAQQLRSAATGERMGGKLARQRGKNAAISSYIGGATSAGSTIYENEKYKSLLTGFGGKK